MTTVLKKNVKEDEDTVIWRYMPLTKLIDLLETRELYFAPLKSYSESDPYEGHMPEFYWQYLFNNHLYRNVQEILGDLTPNKQAEMKEGLQKVLDSTSVNCWHQNEVESEAMWKLYTSGAQGVAIKTTVKKLKESLDKCKDSTVIVIGKVEYIDYSNPQITAEELNDRTGGIQLIKRTSFKHEAEIRAFIQPLAEKNKEDVDSYNIAGIRVPVDVEHLIDELYIYPNADELYKRCVRAICAKYEVKMSKVVDSALLDKPSQGIVFLKDSV